MAGIESGAKRSEAATVDPIAEVIAGLAPEVIARIVAEARPGTLLPVRRDAEAYASFIRRVLASRGIDADRLSFSEAVESTFTDRKAGLGIDVYRESAEYASRKEAEKEAAKAEAAAKKAEADRKAAAKAKADYEAAKAAFEAATAKLPDSGA